MTTFLAVKFLVRFLGRMDNTFGGILSFGPPFGPAPILAQLASMENAQMMMNNFPTIFNKLFLAICSRYNEIMSLFNRYVLENQKGAYIALKQAAF